LRTEGKASQVFQHLEVAGGIGDGAGLVGDVGEGAGDGQHLQDRLQGVLEARLGGSAALVEQFAGGFQGQAAGAVGGVVQGVEQGAAAVRRPEWCLRSNS